MERIAILGAGAMGAALTVPLHTNGHEVRLWGTEYDVALLAKLRAGEEHPALGVRIPDATQLYDPQNLEQALTDADIILLAITSEGVSTILPRMLPHLRPGALLMTVTKGFAYDEQGNVQLISTALALKLPAELRAKQPIVAVGGPCKANEVAAAWPTGTVYASPDTQAAQHCQHIFQTATYRIQVSDDIAGLEIAAALKNVYAIAIGICNGLKNTAGHPWDNLKSAIFQQAIVEMAYIAQAIGGRQETIYGLAGIGDLLVTSISGRNGMFGVQIVADGSAQNAMQTMRNAARTVEGVAAAGLVKTYIKQLEDENKTRMDHYPLLAAMLSILAGETRLVEVLAEAALPALAP